MADKIDDGPEADCDRVRKILLIEGRDRKPHQKRRNGKSHSDDHACAHGIDGQKSETLQRQTKGRAGKYPISIEHESDGETRGRSNNERDGKRHDERNQQPDKPVYGRGR